VKAQKKPKKNASCGSCSLILNEDSLGNGTCDYFNYSTNCSKKGCYAHKQKQKRK